MKEQEESRYDDLKYYMNNTLESFPDDDELETIARLAIKVDKWQKNKGIRVKRTETNPVEKAFHDQWLHENRPDRSVSSSGDGTLQDLFIENKGNPLSVIPHYEIVETINERDRMIVATVIQWLGSNVGMGFLHAALRRVNMSIVQDKIINNG